MKRRIAALVAATTFLWAFGLYLFDIGMPPLDLPQFDEDDLP